MKIKRKLASAIAFVLMFMCLNIGTVSAGSDGTIHIQPNDIVLKQGESVVVDLVSDTDFIAYVSSALDWAFDIGSFVVEQEGNSDFYVGISHKTGNVRLVALNGNVEIEAGVPFCSLRFTALEDARTITRNSNNIKCNIKNDVYEVIDITADDIIINIVSDAPPTAEPVPTADPTAEPTSTPTQRPSIGNTAPVSTVPPTSTPSATPKATTTPEPEATATAEPVQQVFADVPASHWAFEYIMDLYSKAIVNGSGDGNFYPEANITRAEFTKEAVVLFDLEQTDGITEFTDVKADEWYAPFVGAAVNAGIINGVSETEFAPNETVTREQMAAIIGRQLKLTSSNSLEYTDSDSISDYAVEYVAALTEQGLLTGDNGMFRPTATATRAEAAALLSRVELNE